MKFGKQIQKRQLEIPEYAASFVDYKALKKLIKKFSLSPAIPAEHSASDNSTQPDAQSTLQANKGAFFFRLERELDKVNAFYLQKEAELKLRLQTLVDRKAYLHKRTATTSKLSTIYATVEEGLRLFNNDLDKLQQFIEVNQTAFSKILKKWDKSSKSRTKELYLSRAIEVQPCFNRDVISDLSDRATTSLLELGAWAEGENLEYVPSAAPALTSLTGDRAEDSDIDAQTLQALNAGNLQGVNAWIRHLTLEEDKDQRIGQLFTSAASTAPLSCQEELIKENTVKIDYQDQINERSCLHELAISGRVDTLKLLLEHGANTRSVDIYGRMPLHYAAMHGHVDAISALALADNAREGQISSYTINAPDLDNFTPLIHAIAHSHFEAVKLLTTLGARVDPITDSDHSPLNLACQHGSVPIVGLLLESKAQIIPDAEGLYPQHLVPRSGSSPELLLMLQTHGVNLDQPDKLYQWTPLMHAASEGHIECIKTLLACGADVNALDEKGLSAAYYAAWDGHMSCLDLLEKAMSLRTSAKSSDVDMAPQIKQTPFTMGKVPEPEAIPDLALPPPIIPLRRYGHNFLDTTKTFVVINFDTMDSNAIRFYGDNKYPAARLTISSKSSDLIPRNISLPMQDEHRTISFQIDSLATFSIDFDIFPSFGSKIIARGAASSTVFTSRKSSSGPWHLELFDPRLKAIGRITFDYQVVTPFRDIPTEISQFATYWKATSQTASKKSALNTGSSLSGDFLRIFVQTTRDGVPVLFPRWSIESDLAKYGVHNDLIHRLTSSQLAAISDARQPDRVDKLQQSLRALDTDRSTALDDLSRDLQTSCLSLQDVLKMLPSDVHLEIHVIYPSRFEEDDGQLGPTNNMNTAVDAILSVVFECANTSRAIGDGRVRSIVFSSYNPMICTALNWKQPNYPVLLCNELGVELRAGSQTSSSTDVAGSENQQMSSGRTRISIKEAVRIAQSNNFLGLMCSSRLLDVVPALIETIKSAGLVLIQDMATTKEPNTECRGQGTTGDNVIDGVLRNNSVLSFAKTIDT